MKYKVNVRRMAYREKSFFVDADSPREAQRKAVELAEGEQFPPEYFSEYEPEEPEFIVEED